MKKMKLNAEELRVESFSPAAEPVRGRGTVAGQQGSVYRTCQFPTYCEYFTCEGRTCVYGPTCGMATCLTSCEC